MRIGIDINEANVINRVGSNQYAFEIVRSIERLDKKNDFILYSSRRVVADLPPQREHWQYRVIPPAKLWTQWRLPLALFVHRPRLNVFFTPGHYAPRFSPVPTVVTIMDLAFLSFHRFFRKKDLAQLTNWTKYSVNQAAHIITISQNSKKDISKHYAVSNEKITVAYPGFDRESLKPVSAFDQKRIRAKYNLPAPYILYLGTLQPRKNLVSLVEAFEKLPKKFDQTLLAIAGKTGWLSQDLVKKINQSPKKDRLRLTGFVDPSDVAALYSAAACLALVGLYEGFGIPPLEALACGTIPVVANTASLPEAVGESGILVDPYSVNSINQGLEKALQLTPKEKKNLLTKARSHLKQFSWQEAAGKILKVLYDVAV